MKGIKQTIVVPRLATLEGRWKTRDKVWSTPSGFEALRWREDLAGYIWETQTSAP